MKELYNIDSMVEAFRNLGTKITYDKICQWSKEERRMYNELLYKLKLTNSSSKYTTQEKGKALEDIATFVLKTGNLFKVLKNVRTNTNELDQIIEAQNNTKVLISNNIIDKRLGAFIGECKNYKTKVNVTYVGKLCSLLETTQNRIGIMFSYNGISGNNWSAANGLIKKFYLAKEDLSQRFCIIDFNIKEFESLENGSNILQIIEDKIFSLKYDTGYENYLLEHEATNEIIKFQSNT